MQATDGSTIFTYQYQDCTYDHHNVESKTDIRKGPWTSEDDAKLIDYVTLHGEGRWNSLAALAGLKRTGKSCRLRWLNYLRPNLRRGNLTIEEQLLILDLQSRFGNRWSRIARHLPGRTDNEIKNYWRTRVQKQARQLNCDVDSYQFRYTLRSLWQPRLLEQLWAGSSSIHVQSSSFWTGMDISAAQSGVGPTCTNYKPHQHQQYCSSSTHVPPAWNDCWESRSSNKCTLEDCPVCQSERMCSPLLGGTGFGELDNQALGHTEPTFGSPDIFLSSENFWHSVDQSLESFIIDESQGA